MPKLSWKRGALIRTFRAGGIWQRYSQSAAWFGWLIFLGIASGCGTHGPETEASAEPPATPGVVRAEVAKVQLSSWPASVRTQGSLIADEVAIVGAKVAGRVETLHADLGDSVAAGAPLASLHKEEFELGVTLAEAQLIQSRAALGLNEEDPVEQLVPSNAPPVREAKAVWDEAKARTARLQQLRASNTITAEEFEQAVAAEQVAGARHASALNGVLEKIAYIHVRTVELSLAKQQLADAVIVAPFDGQVEQRHVAPGTFVQVGDPIITLVRASKLRFRGTLPERHAHKLALHQEVLLTVDALPEPIRTKVTRISPVIEQQVRCVVFEALVDNGDGRLGVGAFAEAEVVIDPQAQAILVPRSALVEFAGAEKVWKVVDSMAQEQPVRTARREDDWVEIVDGLTAGDVILIDASQGRVARIDPILTEKLPKARQMAADPAGADPAVVQQSETSTDAAQAAPVFSE
jgi:RND family efflux transporter MFP subunit